MFEPNNYPVFAGFAVAASFTPGPAVMLSVHNALHFGWRRALYSSLGNITGLLVLSCLSALGVNAVLQASSAAFNALKITGALYLFWLGVQQWRTAGHRRRGPSPTDGLAPQSSLREGALARALYVKGMGVALTNPKAIAFIAALFPQFLHANQALAPQYAALTALFMSISLFALSSYASVAVLARARLGRWFGSGWPQRIAGTAFCGFAVALLGLRRGM